MNQKTPLAHNVADHEYQVVGRRLDSWQPSFWRRIPWAGLSALSGALAGVLAAAILLNASNEQPTHDWTVQPTVYLAIFSTATNILLHFAFTRALTVAWWRRALGEDTTIADLHRDWEHGQSLWAALTSGRHFSCIALASILVALVPINGPLLQRASRVRQAHFERYTNVNISIAPEIPEGYTGYLSNRGHAPALLTSDFVKVVQNFNQNSTIAVNVHGCTDSCDTHITGAGLVANCSNSDSSFSLKSDYDITGLSEEEQQDKLQRLVNGTDIFNTNLEWARNGQGPGATFSLGVTYKGTVECAGTLAVRNCAIRAATVTYPVWIDGNSSSISLAPGTTMFDDKLVEVIALSPDWGIDTDSSFNISTYGGYFLTISNTYTSNMHMNFGGIGYQISNEGALSNRYVNTSEKLRYLNCSMSFRDPTDDIIAAMRELMFRTALASAQPANLQSVTAHEIVDTPVYEASYRFLALAVLFSLLGWLATIPVFLGWWHLGRKVSMSPIEIAKAFAAPGLKECNSNADAEGMLKEIGKQEVRYGALTTATARDSSDRVNERPRLLIAEPGQVRIPKTGEIFMD